MTENKYPQYKVQAVQDLEELIKNSASIFLTDYKGLNVENITQLRNKLHEKEVTYRIAKNTLCRIAMKNCGYDGMIDYLEGPTAIAFSRSDPTAPAKIILEFAKDKNLPVMKSCIFEGHIYGPEKIEFIKNLPARDQILAELLGQIQAPLSVFVGLLNEIIRSFLGVLEAVIQQKGGAEQTE
ncbi:50S ribosomal protein L10 [bacterium]|nr:50S ribosomal protein L10 [FCB group bacterium]MBL7191290.1 50S ribosomal protein L10 [bacterium]